MDDTRNVLAMATAFNSYIDLDTKRCMLLFPYNAFIQGYIDENTTLRNEYIRFSLKLTTSILQPLENEVIIAIKCRYNQSLHKEKFFQLK